MDYNEKLRLAKEALNSGHYDKETIEYIFPELKESEDEKIKNFMIKVFKSYQNPTYHINPDKWEGLEISKILSWLEKQGKNNTDNDTQFEKQGEQESTDKIEPKFKVGDWIVPNNGEPKVFRVEKRGCFDSIISSSLGNQFINTITLDKQYHLWTIQDARNGDVLAYPDNTIVLFKNLHKGEDEGVFTVHCLYLDNKIEGMTTCAVADIHPSTKEQRNLLISKMNEAGYEWDAEKKELKKIGQEEDARLTDFESALFSAFSDAWQEYLSGKEVNVEKWTKEHSAELLEIAREQKPALSEDDEYTIEELLCLLDNEQDNYPQLSCNFQEIEEIKNWLKSIKERYTWKPSNEQMEALYTYIYNPQYFNSPDPRMELVESVYKDLKKLREE